MVLPDGIYLAKGSEILTWLITAICYRRGYNSAVKKFNITTSIQPGGPDEMREDMESTHQCSADGILMHFKILAA